MASRSKSRKFWSKCGAPGPATGAGRLRSVRPCPWSLFLGLPTISQYPEGAPRAMPGTDNNPALRKIWKWEGQAFEDQGGENHAIRQFGHTIVEVFSNAVKSVSSSNGWFFFPSGRQARHQLVADAIHTYGSPDEVSRPPGALHSWQSDLGRRIRYWLNGN